MDILQFMMACFVAMYPEYKPVPMPSLRYESAESYSRVAADPRFQAHYAFTPQGTIVVQLNHPKRESSLLHEMCHHVHRFNGINTFDFRKHMECYDAGARLAQCDALVGEQRSVLLQTPTLRR